MAMGKWLGPALDALAAPGGYVLANQPLDVARWRRLPDPPGVPTDRYFLYRVESISSVSAESGGGASQCPQSPSDGERSMRIRGRKGTSVSG